MSSNSGTIYVLDGDLFTLLSVVKFVMMFEKTKINEKEAGVGPFKNVFSLFISTPNRKIGCYRSPILMEHPPSQHEVSIVQTFNCNKKYLSPINTLAFPYFDLFEL